MEILRFRATPGQLRSLGISNSVVAVVAVALYTWVEHSGAGIWSRAGSYALALLVLVPFLLWLTVAYACSFTECTSDGIRARGLGRTRRCSWPEVADIALRTIRGNTVIRVRRTDGSQFQLGVPVSGGIMPDPGCPEKFTRIRGYWLEAAGHGGTELALSKPAQTGADYATTSRTRTTYQRFMLAFALAVAIAAPVLGVVTVAKSLRASSDQGINGVFLVDSEQCHTTCTLAGSFGFPAPSKDILLNMFYSGSPPPGTHVGDVIPARFYPGGYSSRRVYPLPGAPAWIQESVSLGVVECAAIGWLVVGRAALRDNRLRAPATSWP